MTEQFSNLYDILFEANGLTKVSDEAKKGVTLSFIDRMVEVNAKMNLSAIRDPKDILRLHIVDSLTLLPFLSEGITLLDVGAGGGFPSIPIAIFRPDVRVVALDSTGKKTEYIDGVAKTFGLGNLSTLTGRAEDFAKEPAYREKFDVVTARGVAELRVLAELCLPFGKPGGCFLAMKGNYADELSSADRALSLLGGSKPTLHRLSLLDENGHGEDRVIVESVKEKPCPTIYPRVYSQIRKKPL